MNTKQLYTPPTIKVRPLDLDGDVLFLGLHSASASTTEKEPIKQKPDYRNTVWSDGSAWKEK